MLLRSQRYTTASIFTKLPLQILFCTCFDRKQTKFHRHFKPGNDTITENYTIFSAIMVLPTWGGTHTDARGNVVMPTTITSVTASSPSRPSNDRLISRSAGRKKKLSTPTESPVRESLQSSHPRTGAPFVAQFTF